MIRTSSQETEAPLSQETYELLVRGLHGDSENDGGDLFQKQAPANFEMNFGVSLPPCADSLRPPQTTFMTVCSLQGKPSDAPYPGDYDFRIGFDPSQKPIQKSIPHTFSEQLNQLFCNIETLVPIKFYYGEHVPRNCYIRALLAGKRDDFIVKTCAKHNEEAREKGNVKSHQHVLQFKTPNAVYGNCSNTGIFFVQIPIQPRQAGIDYQLEMVRFMCYNSDLRSKVDLQIVFTLENSGTVIGRQAIGLRVCACPGRDRRSYEKRMLKREHSLKLHSSSDDNRAKKKKKRVRVQENEEIYTLSYRDKKRFDQIKHISQALDALEAKDTMSNLPTGVLKPAERTASGGVSKWLLENSEMVSTSKIYPDRRKNPEKENDGEAS